MMSASVCCVQCAKSSLSGEKPADSLICKKTGQITGWGSSCAEFVGRYPIRAAGVVAGAPQRRRSEERTATPAAIPSSGTEAATRGRTHALGKAIPSLPSTGGASE